MSLKRRKIISRLKWYDNFFLFSKDGFKIKNEALIENLEFLESTNNHLVQLLDKIQHQDSEVISENFCELKEAIIEVKKVSKIIKKN